MHALTTVFSPPAWCSDRFVVYVDDHAPGTSILPPSSGWIDPSYTKCIPTQYTETFQTFSPGVCPQNMAIATSTSTVHNGKTFWTAGCCQTGFVPMSVDPHYFCTSTLTAPMAFLLDPNVSTADVYTTLPPPLEIHHDQMTVQWEQSDLTIFPAEVISQYAAIMGIPPPTSTGNSQPVVTSSSSSSLATTAPMTTSSTSETSTDSTSSTEISSSTSSSSSITSPPSTSSASASSSETLSSASSSQSITSSSAIPSVSSNSSTTDSALSTPAVTSSLTSSAEATIASITNFDTPPGPTLSPSETSVTNSGACGRLVTRMVLIVFVLLMTMV